jgi:undecaprenyl-diphosphatase
LLELIEAVILGVVQGLTEFLPVSSSGHLLLGQYFLGLDQDRFGLSFDVALHMGTLVAVVSYFWRDLIRMALAFLRSFGNRDLVNDPDQRLAYLVIASTIPAALIGYLFEGFFEDTIRSPWVVVFNFVLVGVLFLVAEAAASRSRRATITLGLFLGLRREEAARFSFLMSVPIIAGAGGLQLAEVITSGMSTHELLLFVTGFVSSAVVGYFTIRFLLHYLTGHSLRAFAYYRFAVAAVVALLLIVF